MAVDRGPLSLDVALEGIRKSGYTFRGMRFLVWHAIQELLLLVHIVHHGPKNTDFQPGEVCPPMTALEDIDRLRLYFTKECPVEMLARGLTADEARAQTRHLSGARGLIFCCHDLMAVTIPLYHEGFRRHARTYSQVRQFKRFTYSGCTAASAHELLFDLLQEVERHLGTCFKAFISQAIPPKDFCPDQVSPRTWSRIFALLKDRLGSIVPKDLDRLGTGTDQENYSAAGEIRAAHTTVQPVPGKDVPDAGDATQAQPPPVGRPRGTPLEEANILVRVFLEENARDNPAAITRDAVAKATGVSTGQVSKTPAWQAFRERRDAEAKPEVREVPLTERMRSVVPDNCETPYEIAALIEEQKAEEAEQELRHKRRDERRDERRHGPS
jgi:hypothetical protein